MNQSTMNVTSPMPADLELRARLAAARLRISRAELIRRAVIRYLTEIEAETTTKGGNQQCG